MSTLTIETPRVYVPLLQDARYKGAHGGRGSGKSHFFAEMLVEDCIREPIDAVCLREIQKSLKFSVKKLIESKIQTMNAGLYFEVQNEQIKCRPASGGSGVIIFQGMQDHTADSIKSLEGFKRAWFEEAQSASQRSLDLLRPTIRTPGSQLWFTWNPRFATDPVELLLRGPEKPPNAVVVEANYSDNPWLPAELLEEMEYDRRRDPDKYAHIWLGKYQQNTQARVFHNWTVEEFEAPASATFRLGADWGFSVDPSVLVRCHIDGKRLYIDYEAYMVGCEIDQLPDLFDRVPDSRKWFITADSARPETISYMRRHGYPKINPAIKGPKSLEEGVEFLKSFDIIVHPRCTHLIDELTMYKYKEDPLTGQILPILKDKDNHVIDALRYACEAARKALKPERPQVKQSRATSGGWMG
ncbi:MAG TPA: PBSX family phage terminase large subunit [Methylophilaceae bacterium]|nr:PBSX family phage terminase large subunit [Methylophilaceae bacterium]